MVTPDDEVIMLTPRSAFVLRTMRGLRFTTRNRKYIEQLLRMERFACARPTSWAGAMLEHSLRCRYPTEYVAIVGELAPWRYARELRAALAEARATEREARRERAARRVERMRLRERWKDAGG